MNASLSASLSEYPWLQPDWERVSGDPNELHHGLLITGVPGIAKREFAMTLAQGLLCDGNSENGRTARPCGKCRNCQLFTAATHPDFHVLTTEQEFQDGRIALVAQYCNRYQDAAARSKRATMSRVIPVDQVRALIERFCVYPHIARRKVALILPADRMNANAANALLKLLEEPPGDSSLLLVSAFPGYLPATIRSRCFRIQMTLPTAEAAAQWLQARLPTAQPADLQAALRLANGAPLAAHAALESGFLSAQERFLQGIAELSTARIGALELVARFKEHDFLQMLYWLHRFCCELIKWRCGAGLPVWHASIERSGLDAGKLRVERLFTLYDRLGYYRKIARDQLNEQLALEEITLTLQGAVRG